MSSVKEIIYTPKIHITDTCIRMTDEEFVDQLKRHEGVVDHAYQDSLGYWTIGVGRLIDKRKGGRLTPTEIDYLLSNDITEKCEELKKAIPWLTNLSVPRQQVLVNMAFNMGVNNLLGFKNTLEMIRTGKYDAAAKAMLQSKWATQVGSRAKELSEQMRLG